MEPRTPARVVSKLLSILIVLTCVQGVIASEATKLPGTYSSLAYNVEGGDLIGYEVRLIPTNEGVKAVVQVAEGDAGRIYIVDVTGGAEKLLFEVPLASGVRGMFSGKVTADAIIGKITFPGSESEVLHLRRTISYWEK